MLEQRELWTFATLLPTGELADQTAALLHNQPFVIDDDRHTGVAYSWLYSGDPTEDRYGDFVFDRRTLPQET